MIKLLSSLKKLAADNCVILTYNLDLPFFEASLFEPVYGFGCRNTLVICDPQQYQIALEDIPLLRFAGQRYLVFPGRTSERGAFHPKLVLLTSRKEGALFLTSGNLSRAGYTSNWEVVTEFVYDERHPDVSTLKAFRWAYETIKKIVAVSDPSGLGEERLERLWASTPWLREDSPETEEAPLWMMNNLEVPLLKQIGTIYREKDGSPIEKAVVISPFFDNQMQALEALLSNLQPNSVDMYTQNPQNLNSNALKKVLGVYQTKFTINQLSISRRLHAKALLFQTQKGTWLASGSANFSAPALLHKALSGNTEIVTLRHEPSAIYFDQWLNELIAESIPLDIKNIPVLPPVPPPVVLRPAFKLEMARLTGFKLELLISPMPPLGSTICVNFGEERFFSKEYIIQKQSAAGWVTISLPKELVSQLETPTLVYITQTNSEGMTLRSTSVLILNVTMLERFSRPPNNPKGPKIPVGLVTENEEECARLLEIIHNLLITNQEQLIRHSPHIVAERKREDQEEQIVEEYNPDDHIVDEPIRKPFGGKRTGDELYIDYDERLTYQQILNAVLEAIYHPDVPPTDIPPVVIPPMKPKDGRPIPQPEATLEEIKKRLRARISSGFEQLIGNFLKGLLDANYMATVSSQYLFEVWSIITTYLRIVWLNDWLDQEKYCDFSLALFYGFWGKPAEPGAWQTFLYHYEKVELDAEFTRLSLPLNTWLHAASLANLLEASDDKRRFDLAGWMRLFTKNVSSPDTLSTIDELAYRGAWKTCFPKNAEIIPASTVTEQIYRASQTYDDQSVKDEIQDLTGFMPIIEYGKITNLSQVPKLSIRMPLNESALDSCLKVFQFFMNRPKAKSFAWARFENTNPTVTEDDFRSVTVFLRGDENTFIFAAERHKEGDYRPEYQITEATPEKINQIQTLADIQAINSLE